MDLARRWTLVIALLGAASLLGTDANAQFRCPPGYFRNRFGRCVPRMVVPRGCPPGYILDRLGRCRAVVVRPRVCPPGYFFFRGRCVRR
ncbi:MAG: hypothetical protein HY909_28620 [Deltaproteobacteria bacterium]|nr:hypothetical protein [Deltaproteobacteria bacterium]